MPKLKTCLLVGLGAQVPAASGLLHFESADKGITGRLFFETPPAVEYEPEVIDAYRLLDAIAPCGPFVRAAPHRPWQTQPTLESFVPVAYLPQPFVIEMSGANASVHACVQAASWHAARCEGGGEAALNRLALVLGFVAMIGILTLNAGEAARPHRD